MSTTHSSDAGPACDACGSDDVVPVVYGLPTAEMWQHKAAGDIVLGGCMNDDRQAWRCRTCDQTTYLPTRTTFIAIWEDGTLTEEIADWIVDPTGADVDRADDDDDDDDDAEEERRHRQENLEMLQESYDLGNVYLDDRDLWLTEEDAITEVGAHRALELRELMADHLAAEWQKFGRQHDGGAPIADRRPSP